MHGKQDKVSLPPKMAELKMYHVYTAAPSHLLLELFSAHATSWHRERALLHTQSREATDCARSHAGTWTLRLSS